MGCRPVTPHYRPTACGLASASCASRLSMRLVHPSGMSPRIVRLCLSQSLCFYARLRSLYPGSARLTRYAASPLRVRRCRHLTIQNYIHTPFKQRFSIKITTFAKHLNHTNHGNHTHRHTTHRAPLIRLQGAGSIVLPIHRPGIRKHPPQTMDKGHSKTP